MLNCNPSFRTSHFLQKVYPTQNSIPTTVLSTSSVKYLMASAVGQLHSTGAVAHLKLSYPPPPPGISRSPVAFFCGGDKKKNKSRQLSKLSGFCGHWNLTSALKASPESEGIMSADDPEEGVSLGTMKLPSNTDLQRFETLLFQWANSLCQGANLPLPVPLKIDKISGGVRLGFITIGDGKTEVLVYIDCIVFPAAGGSGPIFRAIRNGPLKDKSPPGEPRIMRGLLQALQKSVEIARV